MATEYALYKGEDLICMGTIHEIAEFRNVKPETVRFYLTPTYQKRINKRKNPRNYITLTKMGDDEDE